MRFIINTILFATALTIVLCDRDFTIGQRVLAVITLAVQCVCIAGSLEFGFLAHEEKRSRT